jgi:glycosyltransferase involved in cell wall biosynthesis
MRILVVGNYLADQQQSMNRFAELLVRFYQPRAQVHLIRPPVLVTRMHALPPIARKYLAYIDKLFIFPIWLILHSRSYQVVHIADHGNAIYAFCCPRQRCIVTCHDLLAVRGAMGDSTIACDSSPIGIWLQRLIVAGLKHAGAVTFVSKYSFNDFQHLVGAPLGQRHTVIPNPLNANFSPNSNTTLLSAKEQAEIPSAPFLLMVGSALPRKNRALALRVLQHLGPTSPYCVVFAGAPLAQDEQAFITEHKLSSRVVSIVRPSHPFLNHLYCSAHALLFPSLSEGFGWPLIEAQTCACPVIASCTTSIPEVAGRAALFAAPNDVAAFSRHVQALEDQVLRRRIVSEGFQNVRRFDSESVSRAYVSFALATSLRSAV